nr:hypothetical protein [Candidatus Sigynarchaeum springense]
MDLNHRVLPCRGSAVAAGPAGCVFDTGDRGGKLGSRRRTLTVVLQVMSLAD